MNAERPDRRLPAAALAMAVAVLAAIVTLAAASGSHAAATADPAPVGKCTQGQSAVAASDLALPQRMLIDRFSFQPTVVTSGTSAVTGRIHVADTCGRSVAGAQLWSTAVRYNQTSVVKGNTGGDSWATLQFRLQRGFPANPGRQQILAVLVLAGSRATASSRASLRGASCA